MAKGIRKEAAEDSPVTAANFVRGRARSMLEGGKTGTSGFAAERDALIEWFDRRNAVLPQAFCRQFGTVATGAEHSVFLDLEGFRAIKITHPNRFGHSVYAEGVQATPLEYLRRLAFHNILLGDDIHLLGCVLGDEGFQIIISQPWVTAHADTPGASEAQIDSYLGELRFRRSQLFTHGTVFYSDYFDLVIADAHSGNVLISEDGKVIPIDLVIGRPGPHLEFLLKQELPPGTVSEPSGTSFTYTPRPTGAPD